MSTIILSGTVRVYEFPHRVAHELYTGESGESKVMEVAVDLVERHIPLSISQSLADGAPEAQVMTLYRDLLSQPPTVLLGLPGAVFQRLQQANVNPVVRVLGGCQLAYGTICIPTTTSLAVKNPVQFGEVTATAQSRERVRLAISQAQGEASRMIERHRRFTQWWQRLCAGLGGSSKAHTEIVQVAQFLHRQPTIELNGDGWVGDLVYRCLKDDFHVMLQTHRITRYGKSDLYYTFLFVSRAENARLPCRFRSVVPSSVYSSLLD